MINIKLDSKPISISIRYNSYYKIVLLLAIIEYSGYRRRASLELLHIVFWSLRNDRNYQILLDFSKKERNDLVSWTFEHGIEKVLSLGFINKYIERVIVGQNLEIKITDKGRDIVNSINEFDLFQDELNQIRALGTIPKSRLTSANNNWSLI